MANTDRLENEKLDANGPTLNAPVLPDLVDKLSSNKSPSAPNMPKPVVLGGSCSSCTKPLSACLCPKGGGSGGGDDSDHSDADLPEDTRAAIDAQETPTHTLFPDLDEVYNPAQETPTLAPEANEAHNLENFEFTVDEQKGSLSIAPKPGSVLDPEQVARYFSALDQHFTSFKNQLAAQGLPAEGFTREQSGNTLTFGIPAPHYLNFIQSLVDKGLAPPSVLQQLKANTAQLAEVVPKSDTFGRNSLFGFPSAPTPGTGGKVDEDKHQFMTPFNTKLTPPGEI